MNYTESLKSNNDYKEIYRTGKSYANKYLVMYIRRNNLDKNRLGISVSKKVGNSVVRHRITRLVRESYRKSEDRLCYGFDIVIVARVGTKGREYSDIESAVMHLVKLHRIGKESGII